MYNYIFFQAAHPQHISTHRPKHNVPRKAKKSEAPKQTKNKGKFKKNRHLHKQKRYPKNRHLHKQNSRTILANTTILGYNYNFCKLIAPGANFNIKNIASVLNRHNKLFKTHQFGGER